MSNQSTAREDITFEQGYEELKEIVSRLGSDDVSVHEMFEGFRRGKGLEKSLRQYLTEREGELTEIEAGKGVPEFNIVAPSGEPTSQAQISALEDDFAPTPAVSRKNTVDDDNIPF